VIVDETGNEVADLLLDPIRELEKPEEERYAVMLKRRDGNGALPPVSFLFRSGEPARECRDLKGAETQDHAAALEYSWMSPPRRSRRSTGP
jgi:hypothetical protein